MSHFSIRQSRGLSTRSFVIGRKALKEDLALQKDNKRFQRLVVEYNRHEVSRVPAADNHVFADLAGPYVTLVLRHRSRTDSDS